MKRKIENFEKTVDRAIAKSLVKENGKPKVLKGLFLSLLTLFSFPLLLIYDVIKWLLCCFIVLEDEEDEEEKKAEN